MISTKTALGWQLLPAADSFHELRADWDRLNRVGSNHVLLDSRLVAALVACFGSRETMLAVNSASPTSHLALLERSGIGNWSTFQPSQSPLGLLLFGEKPAAYDRLFDLMHALPAYVAILGVLQQDPECSVLFPVPDSRKVEMVSYIETPCLRLQGSFEDYWKSRSKNLRHNLDRQHRRLREGNRTLELVSERRPEAMSACVRTYGEMESAGWKAAGGTAIGDGNQQGRFYREILENFASTGEAVVYQLLLDGEVVASDLCLARGEMMVVLKTTYAENLEKLSPALLMRREIVRELHDEGQIGVIEFYGPLRNWHRQWMSHTRTMFHVNVFRHRSVMRTREVLRSLR